MMLACNFFIPILTGIPWVPSNDIRIRLALELASLQPGETLVDLGCGDGRVLIAAARDFGAHAIGIEISALHCLVARLRVRAAWLAAALWALLCWRAGHAGWALAGALLFYLAVRMASTGPGRLYWVSIPLAIILPLTTKLTVLPVSLAVLLTAGWQMIRSPKHGKQLAVLGLIAGGMLIIVFAIAPVILRTAEYEISWRLLNFRPDAASPKYIVYISKQIIWTYWGRLGWMAIALPAPILVGLCGFSLIGMMISAWKLIRARANFPQFGAWVVTWLTSILTVVAVMKNAANPTAAQAFGERGTGAARGDCQRNPAASYQRRHKEVACGRRRDAVHQQIAAVCFRANSLVHCEVIGGGNRQARTVKIAAAIASPHPAHAFRSCKSVDGRGGLRADNRHRGFGLEQCANFTRGDTARADDDGGLIGEVEKEWVTHLRNWLRG